MVYHTKQILFYFLILFFVVNQTRIKKKHLILRAPRPHTTSLTGATSLLPSINQSIVAIVAQQLQAATNSGAIATTAANLGAGAGIFCKQISFFA